MHALKTPVFRLGGRTCGHFGPCRFWWQVCREVLGDYQAIAKKMLASIALTAAQAAGADTKGRA